MIAVSSSSPPTRTLFAPTMPESEMTATSVCAAADIDDHAAGRLRDREPDADRRRHRLLDEHDFPGAGALGRILHRPLFDLGDAGRDGHEHARAQQPLAPRNVADRFLDEVAQHLFGDFEVGNDAVLHRTDGPDVARTFAEHAFRLAADIEHFMGALFDRHDRRFVQNDPEIPHVNQTIGGSEVNSDMGRKKFCHALSTHRTLILNCMEFNTQNYPHDIINLVLPEIAS